MRYYTYDIIVKNQTILEDELTSEEKKLGYIPTRLDREINRIYNENEEVVSMTITPIMKTGNYLSDSYHIIYVTRD